MQLPQADLHTRQLIIYLFINTNIIGDTCDFSTYKYLVTNATRFGFYLKYLSRNKQMMRYTH
jgi:hypothetical protein